jgi:hypothetical protein
MTPYLAALTDQQRTKIARDSRKALRAAWPHRHTSFRAPIVIRANVTMLRNLSV